MEISGVHHYQIPGIGGKIVIIDAQTGGTGAQINQFDFLMPVSQKADILIGGMPYHKIGIIAAHFVKRFQRGCVPPFFRNSSTMLNGNFLSSYHTRNIKICLYSDRNLRANFWEMLYNQYRIRGNHEGTIGKICKNYGQMPGRPLTGRYSGI